MVAFAVLLILGFVAFAIYVCYAAISSHNKLAAMDWSARDYERKLARLEFELGELHRKVFEITSGKAEQKPEQKPEHRAEEARERIVPAPVPPPPPPPFREETPEIPAAPAPVPAEEVAEFLNQTPEKPVDAAPEPVAAATEAELPPSDPAPANVSGPSINWELFTGKYLFAWIGGFALFLGAAFFVKYSFDHNLITPMMRVFFGALTGVGLIIASVYVTDPKLKVTARTLAAAGIAILYADIYAAKTLYSFLTPVQGILLMTLTTFTGFFIAVRIEGKYTAVLSAVGGFLTPVLMSTGQNNPVGLFTYVAFIDAGLIMTAKTAGWRFPVALAAAGTTMLQLGWFAKFFQPKDVWTAAVIFDVYAALFAFVAWKAEKWRIDGGSLRYGCALTLVFPAIMSFVLLLGNELGNTPLAGFSLLAVVSISSGLLLLRGGGWGTVHKVIGSIVFTALLTWTARCLSADTLYTGLAAYVIFAVLFPAMSIMSARRLSLSGPGLFGSIYPLLMIITVLAGLIKTEAALFLLWPVLFLLALAVGVVSVLSGLAWLFAAAIALVTGGFLAWIGFSPVSVEFAGMTGLVLAFAVASFAFGLWAARRFRGAGVTATGLCDLTSFSSLPLLSALTPFVFVMAALTKMKPDNPSLLFGVCAILSAMLLYISREYRVQELPSVAAAAWGICQFLWQQQHPFETGSAVFGLPPAGFASLLASSYLFFFVLYAALFRSRLKEHWGPWAGALTAGVISFLCLFPAWKSLLGTGFIGALPAALAAVFMLLLLLTAGLGQVSEEPQKTRLALSGAGVLLFVTLIFPIQFDRQWITIGWALEGLSLVWLYSRVPHEGLKHAAAFLLLAAFVRLGVNPSVFDYSLRSTTPILNWYLYAYGIVAAALFLARHIWPKEENPSLPGQCSKVFPAAGTLLLFLLMNIEIADFFSVGDRIDFFSGANFARDLSYTVGWGLFASVLLGAGLMLKNGVARKASILLFGVTLIKLFFMDLWQLSLIYRAAAFVALAIMLMSASFVYQRFLSGEEKTDA